jgi:phosphatidylserine/phosphatidylglycerophosphate/cardiolipin synthase-like enzyme
MSRGLRALIAVPLAAALLLPAAAIQADAATAHVPDAVKTAPLTAKKAASKKDKYWPKGGPLFNNPLGSSAGQHVIERHIVRAINHAHKHSLIRIATWSFFNTPVTGALARAHKRGVSVRIVMPTNKAEASRPFRILRHVFKKYGNKRRIPERRSGVRTCSGTCRGTHGTMHAKVFMFSHTGRATDTMMWGSANITNTAVRGQWNDMYTVSARKHLFDYGMKIYKQYWRDKPVKGPYEVHHFGPIGYAVTPYHGTSDWISKKLANVKCHGATNTKDGRTHIQVAQAIIGGDMGIRIARHLHNLKRAGCRVIVLYTRMSKKPRHLLSNIQTRHIVQDNDGDGLYDRYLHMKILTIRGYLRHDTGTTQVMNGSSNWSDFSMHNDETVGYFSQANVWSKYSHWINYVFRHPPVSVVYRVQTDARSMFGGRVTQPAKPANPYKNLELD